jgi:rifampicin phosphotransferase
MKPFVLPLSDPQADLETVGGKGMSLAKLANAGLPVPDAFHVTTEAYRQFVAANRLQPRILKTLEKVDAAQPSTLEAASVAIGQLFGEAEIPANLAYATVEAYKALPGANPAVAVRSSATAEDLPGASFAGQQETYLNIQGADAVLEAVRKCWASLWTGRAIAYRLRQEIDPSKIALAVVVQLLVPAEAAGILFTANPLTGKRGEAVINAAWGLGEAIVGGAVTPDMITVDKLKGRVLQRETAVKQVMTVRTETGTEEQPVPEKQKNTPVLSNKKATELARTGSRIEKLYGMPMDIEWTLTGGKFAILQARPITALPVEWKLPNPKGQYMRGSVVDIMPDPLSPLFATLGIPAIARVGMKQVLRSLTRSEPDFPDYIQIINDYAYLGVAFTPHQWWWILVRMVGSFPRILRDGLPLWRDEIRPRYAETSARWQARSLQAISSTELWAGVQEINDAAMIHMASLLVSTTGASAGAELLFSRVYEKMVRREGDPPAPVFLMGYNSTPIQAEKSLYDLAAWAGTQSDMVTAILDTPASALAVQLRSIPVSPAWLDFSERLQAHLQTYGHIAYDLDFAKALPLDDTTPMLETIKMYLCGAGINPHERQKALEVRRIQAVEAMLKRLKGLKAWAFRKSLGWAQSLAEVRENALSDIGLGYPALRRMLNQLGGRMVAAGAILQPDDCYWFERAELEQAVTALARGEALESLAERVEQRKRRWREFKQATPPPMLPPRKKYLGFNMADWTPATAESQTGGTLKGVAASAGKVTAAACVLHGPEDFGRMRPGNVLVAVITTPAWTSLFAMASAVVTDIGGPLSHGSIVAREYGIPAVMGTGVATKRIRDGQMITVDGEAGTVTLKE